MTSYMQKKEEVKRDWFVIDAEGKPIGRVATLDATYLRDGGDRYKSYIGAIYYRNDKYERVTSGGVGAHPGDYGFTCMANTVIQALKDNNFAVYSNN